MYGSIVVGVGVTTTTTVVVVGLPGTVTITVDTGGGDVGDGSVVIGAAEIVDGVEAIVTVGDKELGAQGVPTSSKAVVIVIQASCDCFDNISTAALSITA